MFAIVLHHYCVNSGLISVLNIAHPDFNTLWVQFASIGGKVGVNIFFLITGYFMCRSRMHWTKLVQLAFQIGSISLIIWLCLNLHGIRYTWLDLLSMVPLLATVHVSFISTYATLYILSPVINKSLDSLSQRDINYLLIVLLVYFSLLPSLLIGNTWHYLGWGFTMYTTGYYVRRFNMASRKLPYGLISIVCILLTWVGIYVMDILQTRFHLNTVNWMFLMTDANKLNLLLISVATFMFFARLKMSNIKIVNRIGGGYLLRRTSMACIRRATAALAVARYARQRRSLLLTIPVAPLHT